MTNRDREQYFNTVYEATFEALGRHVFFKVARLADAEDIVQDIYTDFYRYTVLKDKHPDQVMAYLYKMADHALARYYAKRIPEGDLEDTLPEGLEGLPDSLDLEAEVFDRIEADRLWATVQRLNPKSQQVLIAYFRYGLTFREIAEALEEKEITVRQRLYRALAKLRKDLDL